MTDQFSERERTIYRIATLTTYRQSRTFERIGQLQKEIGSIRDAKELLELHDSIDLTQEASPLSPTTELYYLLKGEVVFAQLRNPGEERISTSDALEQLGSYGALRQERVQDPTVWLEYQILSGMYALQNNRQDEAESHLREFDAITNPFNVSADKDYVTQMRRHIANRETEKAREVFSKRLATFFPQHFEEVKESFDSKIATMKTMIDDPR